MADPFSDPRSSALTSGTRYPSPFFQLSTLFLPPRLKDLFKFCQYYAFSDELISATIYRLAQFPITDIIYEHKDENLKSRWRKVLEEDLGIRTRLEEAGLDYFCFHGDVKAVTKDGVFKLRDLVGKAVEVLSKDGVYRKATFKSFGRQELMEVEFKDGRTVLATPEHQWPTLTSADSIKLVTTTELEGRSLFRNVAPRPEKNEEFYEGVRHGFVFGDGTLYNDGKQARAAFFGEKDKEMLKYFEAHPQKPYEAQPGVIFIHGLPPRYKQLPENGASASYWYGFVCGFLAADGHCDARDGCAVLTQNSQATLEVIADQLPRIGMVPSPVRAYDTITSYGPTIQCFLGLQKQFMVSDDFLLTPHRQNFEANVGDSMYGRFTKVKEVRWTGIVDEVFCCVEPETHTFTLANGVLTGNCYGNALFSVYIPFIRFLCCPNCGQKRPIKSMQFKFQYKDYRFYSKCSKCSPETPLAMDVEDRPLNKVTAGMNIVRWDPHQIDIEHNPISGSSAYYYNIPNQLKRQILSGRRRIMEETPMSFIMAVKESARVELERDNLFHSKRPSMSFFDVGWGMPLIVPLLKSKYILEIFLKAREALAQQHILPLWMLYPLSQANIDSHATLAMSTWRQQMESMIKRWRRDPNFVGISPIPTGFQQIGGDGRMLSVMEEIRFLQETQIVGLQVPKEFVLGGTSWSGSAVTFRMVENFFLNHVRNMRLLMKFVIEKVSKVTKLQPVDVSMTRLKWVDDIQQKSLLLNAASQGKISDETLVGELGHSLTKEFERMTNEVKERGKILKEQAKTQAEAQGEAMMVQMRYQLQMQMEQAKMQKNHEAELLAMGFDPMQIQQMFSATQQPQGQGGQFDPGGILKKEPNKAGTGKGGGGGMVAQPADPELWGGQYASTLMQMNDLEREQNLLKLQLESPQLHGIVVQKMMELQGVDARPNPEQRPPRRLPGPTPTPSGAK